MEIFMFAITVGGDYFTEKVYADSQEDAWDEIYGLYPSAYIELI
jgi:hypothetical protein